MRKRVRTLLLWELGTGSAADTLAEPGAFLAMAPPPETEALLAVQRWLREDMGEADPGAIARSAFAIAQQRPVAVETAEGKPPDAPLQWPDSFPELPATPAGIEPGSAIDVALATSIPPRLRLALADTVRRGGGGATLPRDERHRPAGRARRGSAPLAGRGTGTLRRRRG